MGTYPVASLDPAGSIEAERRRVGSIAGFPVDSRDEIIREAQSATGLHARVRKWMDTPRRGPGGIIDWHRIRVENATIASFVDSVLREVNALPAEIRAGELEKILKDIDPSLDEYVKAETARLVRDGHSPARALRAAFGGCLVARRKKHVWMAQNVVIPFQSQKIAEGIYQATPDPKERARRIKIVIDGLVPKRRPQYDSKQAAVRLKEIGLSREQVRQVLRAPWLTSEDVARGIQLDMDRGVAPVEAIRHGVERAMRAFLLDVVKADVVSSGVMFCTPIVGAIVGALSVVGTVVGIAVPMAQQVHAERNARRAQNRQKKAPLSTGEVEQLVAAVIRSGATTWGEPQQQAALDYIRVNRFGRTAFVEPEVRNLQTAFNNARAAIVAQEQAVRAARDKKVMIGVGIGAVALIGGALIFKRSRS